MIIVLSLCAIGITPSWHGSGMSMSDTFAAARFGSLISSNVIFFLLFDMPNNLYR
jgi:hypothetical protein